MRGILLKLELLFDFFILAVAASRYVLYNIVWFLTSSLHRFKMIRNCSKKTKIASFIFNNFSRKKCMSLFLRRTYSIYEIWPIGYTRLVNKIWFDNLYRIMTFDLMGLQSNRVIVIMIYTIITWSEEYPFSYLTIRAQFIK